MPAVPPDVNALALAVLVLALLVATVRRIVLLKKTQRNQFVPPDLITPPPTTRLILASNLPDQRLAIPIILANVPCAAQIYNTFPVVASLLYLLYGLYLPVLRLRLSQHPLPLYFLLRPTDPRPATLRQC